MLYRKTKKILLTITTIIFVWAHSSYAQEATINAAPSDQSTPQVLNDKRKTILGTQRGTEGLPFVIKLVPSPPETAVAIHQTKENTGKSSADLLMVFFNALLAFFTFFLWRSTHKLWKSTHKLAESSLEQSKDMKNSITESARAATAMEKVATSIEISAMAATASVATSREISAQQREFSKKQMRAYLSVIIGGGLYQDKNYIFEARPLLINNGHTPARKIRYWARAEILPWPLPPEFTFPHSGQPESHSAVLAAGQNFTLNALVRNGRIPDAEVENVKRGTGNPARRVCIWGIVTYEDIFGDTHTTKFCHGIFWIGKKKAEEKIYGHYADQHNDVD